MVLIHKIKSRVTKILREAWFNASYLAFDRIPKKIKNRRGVKILVYHSVSKNEPTKFNSRFLSLTRFEEHLLAIKKCYHPLSLKDFKEGKISSSKLNVLLTFDDGLKNNFTNALPLLMKYKVPAVFFITAVDNSSHYLFNDILDVFSLIGPETVILNGINFVKRKAGIHNRYYGDNTILLAHYFQNLDSEKRDEVLEQIFRYIPKHEFKQYNEYLALMSHDEIRELSGREGMSVGSHGVSHVDFSAITPEEVLHELKSSKERLETITGKICDSIAFPYGSYTRETITLCKENGYDYLFGTENIREPGDRDFIIERFTVNPFVSAINQMYYIAKNNYE
jgi:peptidoglycan/xylan/chitin deacetylase (PgdA/CDA1 family)